MDVSKIPPADLAAMSLLEAPTGQTGASAAAATLVDLFELRALDLSAALQILLSEVRSALELPPTLQAVMLDPKEAVRSTVQLVLSVMPDDAPDIATWAATLARVETNVPAALERAVNIVVQWRDVPMPVIDASKETRSAVLNLLNDESANLGWLLPEYADLVRQLERFWRRRRLVRRGLSDPDYD